MPDSGKPAQATEDTVWWRLVNLNPAIYRGLVVAIVGALAAVGIIVIPGLPDQLLAVVAAIAAFVQAVWTKSGTTANAQVVVAAPEPVRAPDVVVPGAATTTATTAEVMQAARDDGRA